EVEERRQQRGHCGIVIGDRLEVKACGFDEVRRSQKCLARYPRKLLAFGGTRAEPLANLEADRTAQIAMIEDRSRQGAAKDRIARQAHFGLTPDQTPEFVAGRRHVARLPCLARSLRYGVCVRTALPGPGSLAGSRYTAHAA